MVVAAEEEEQQEEEGVAVATMITREEMETKHQAYARHLECEGAAKEGKNCT